MADIKISALPATSSLTGTDILPCVTDPSGAAATKKITYGDLFGTPPGRFQERKGTDVASANDMTLSSNGNFFKITGTIDINGIATSGWIAGSQVCLWFADALTVANNATPGVGYAPILLSKSIDFLTATDTILGLVFDGSNWQETFRKSPS